MSGPMVVWLDGVLGDVASLGVPVDDRSLLVGDGVFETLPILRIANQPTVFAITRHVRRLADGCATAGVPRPDEPLVRRAVTDVLAGFDGPSGRLRITATGSGHLLVTAAPQPEPASNISVLTSPWIRNERSPLAGVKSTSYAENAYALRWAQGEGADEAAMANSRGELCEGTTSNVFVAIDGNLVTPPLSSGCLPGVTREILLDNGIGVERTLPIGALQQADEVFVTSSLRGVCPVRSIDGRALPDCPGPLTRQAAEVFAEIVRTRVDP